MLGGSRSFWRCRAAAALWKRLLDRGVRLGHDLSICPFGWGCPSAGERLRSESAKAVGFARCWCNGVGWSCCTSRGRGRRGCCLGRDKLSFVYAWMSETPREAFSRCAQEKNLRLFVHEICLIDELLSLWEYLEKVTAQLLANS